MVPDPHGGQRPAPRYRHALPPLGLAALHPAYRCSHRRA